MRERGVAARRGVLGLSGYICAVLSVFAHTLRTALTLSVTADSGSPLTHSSRLIRLIIRLSFGARNIFQKPIPSRGDLHHLTDYTSTTRMHIGLKTVTYFSALDSGKLIVSCL